MAEGVEDKPVWGAKHFYGKGLEFERLSDVADRIAVPPELVARRAPRLWLRVEPDEVKWLEAYGADATPPPLPARKGPQPQVPTPTLPETPDPPLYVVVQVSVDENNAVVSSNAGVMVSVAHSSAERDYWRGELVQPREVPVGDFCLDKDFGKRITPRAGKWASEMPKSAPRSAPVSSDTAKLDEILARLPASVEPQPVARPDTQPPPTPPGATDALVADHDLVIVEALVRVAFLPPEKLTSLKKLKWMVRSRAKGSGAKGASAKGFHPNYSLIARFVCEEISRGPRKAYRTARVADRVPGKKERKSPDGYGKVQVSKRLSAAYDALVGKGTSDDATMLSFAALCLFAAASDHTQAVEPPAADVLARELHATLRQKKSGVAISNDTLRDILLDAKAYWSAAENVVSAGG